MKGKKTARIIVDAAMTAMIVFEMLIQFTGEFLHEIVGFAFFATVVAHLALSAKWMKGTARAAKAGRVKGRQKALAVMGCLLGVTVIVLGLSSVAISGILASAGFVLPIGSYALWANVHAVSAYAFCGLVIVHLAMHWGFAASALRIPYDPSRRQAISTSVGAVAALGVVAVGIAAAGAFAPLAPASAASGTSDAGDADEGKLAPNALDTSGEAPAEDAAINDEPTTQTSSTRSRHKHSRTRSESENGLAEEMQDAENGTDDGADNAPVEAEPSYADSANASEGFVNEPTEVWTEDAADQEESTGALGICTLCRKQCPLSAPRCDKPYQAGLI